MRKTFRADLPSRHSLKTVVTYGCGGRQASFHLVHSDEFTFLGAVTDIVPLLHASDAMVLPSDREGLSNSLLEALSCSVPCIAPPSAGGDQVLTEHSGIVPRDNTPTELAAAMLKIIDPVVRDRLRAGARPTALAYDIEQIITQHVWCYANIRAHVHG